MLLTVTTKQGHDVTINTDNICAFCDYEENNSTRISFVNQEVVQTERVVGKTIRELFKNMGVSVVKV